MSDPQNTSTSEYQAWGIINPRPKTITRAPNAFYGTASVKGVTAGSERTSARASSHHLQVKDIHGRIYRTILYSFRLWAPTTRYHRSQSRNQSKVKKLTVPRRAAGGRTTPPVYWMTKALDKTKNAGPISGRPDGRCVLRDETQAPPAEQGRDKK